MFKSVLRILGVLLRSTFVSLVMFLVTFSVITGEFPPNFSKIKKAFQGMQELSQMSKHRYQLGAPKKNGLQIYSDPAEQDVADLEYLNRRRAEISQDLFQPKNESIVPENSSHEVRRLRSELTEVKIQLYKLQHRVAQLESRQASSKHRR